MLYSNLHYTQAHESMHAQWCTHTLYTTRGSRHETNTVLNYGNPDKQANKKYTLSCGHNAVRIQLASGCQRSELLPLIAGLVFTKAKNTLLTIPFVDITIKVDEYCSKSCAMKDFLCYSRRPENFPHQITSMPPFHHLSHSPYTLTKT